MLEAILRHVFIKIYMQYLDALSPNKPCDKVV